MGRKKKTLELDFTFLDDFHPSFTSKMITQLTESGSTLLGESITNCLWGILIDEDGSKLANDGQGFMKVSAVDWKSYGFDVTIKWSSPEKVNIFPYDNVEDIDIKFFWCEDFPVNAIKKQSKKKTIVVDSITFPFEVEYSGFIESDLLLEVSLNTQLEEDKQIVVDSLKSAFVNWNLETEKSGGNDMKYMKYIKKFNNKYITYFDIGSSGKEGLNYLIDSLAMNEKLEISKVFVKQS
ncbi:hypothetical protein RAH41_01965 [Gottfriedia acidiceleris]|uniref:hypothetical protein n=1 Tax=Gottfriedia acidiceleris TaxID=371036 RepID=UPI002F268BA2